MISQAQKYNVLIVGCGNIAGRFDSDRILSSYPLTHAGAYLKHGGFNIQCCLDSDDGRLIEFARRWSVPNFVKSFSELNVESDSFDVISICSPTVLHANHLLSSIRLNPKVIFCEKPLTLNHNEAMKIDSACRENEISLLVNFSRRWDDAVIRLSKEISAGYWGSIRSVVGHYNKGIMNNGCHMVDLLFQLFGKLELVYASKHVFDYSIDDPTVAVLLNACDGSVPVYLNPGCAQDYSYFELEIITQRGVIRMESGGKIWQYRGVTSKSDFNGYKSLDDRVYVQGGYDAVMERAIENIYDHLTMKTQLINPIGESIAALELCLKIKEFSSTQTTSC